MEVKALLVNEAGLHARPAALFVQTANRFQSNITVSCRGKEGNAKSILAVLALGARQGDEVVIRAEGPDACEAISTLQALIESGLDS